MGIHIVSDSWGICEVEQLEADAGRDNRELQLMAVAGISFYAASGDDGSSDCDRFGITAPEVDDPAAQPYATGVGGTRLDPTTAHHRDRLGRPRPSAPAAGAAASRPSFTMPGWQKGPGVIRKPAVEQDQVRRQDALLPRGARRLVRRRSRTPATSSTAPPAVLRRGWDVFGGTSAAAPLMAAFTADANQFSLANGGSADGLRQPVPLPRVRNGRPGRDVQRRHAGQQQHPRGGTTFPAGAGYDLATGLGSVDVTPMATASRHYTRVGESNPRHRITARRAPKPDLSRVIRPS